MSFPRTGTSKTKGPDPAKQMTKKSELFSGKEASPEYR